ncbi:MAG: CopG family transcriptional regulator [Archangium sp.]|nr:CopG family transcriptional regulator [Archangium sp.]MDP3569731.1 CopG family transcriptional regulator [Archangium sp.]
MESLTIKLPRQLSARVTRLARRRNVSRSALVREALELLTSDRGGETFIDRVSQYVGAGDDLPADILTNPKHMKVYGRRPRL